MTSIKGTVSQPKDYKLVVEKDVWIPLRDGTRTPYGFGWRLSEVAGQKVERHAGAWQGFKTEIARFLGSDLTVVVLCNLAQAEPARFTDAIAALVDPALAKPSAP